MIYYNPKGPEKEILELIDSDGREGNIEIIRQNGEKYVKKNFQSIDEKYIAKLASDLGFGPKIKEIENDYLIEEFILGQTFDKFKGNKKDYENIGEQVGLMFKQLHENDIFYNHYFLSTKFAHHPHLIIKNDLKAILIDYGTSVNLKEFPNLKGEQMESLFGCNLSAYGLENFLNETTKEELLGEGDFNNIFDEFDNDGEFPNKIFKPFSEGFKRTYTGPIEEYIELHKI